MIQIEERVGVLRVIHLISLDITTFSGFKKSFEIANQKII